MSAAITQNNIPIYQGIQQKAIGAVKWGMRNVQEISGAVLNGATKIRDYVQPYFSKAFDVCKNSLNFLSDHKYIVGGVLGFLFVLCCLAREQPDRVDSSAVPPPEQDNSKV